MSKRAVRSLTWAVIFLFAHTPIASAQQSDAAELSKEVRLLRQTIETITATNIRVQIVFGRLQIQEQRTVSATQRLAGARQRLDEIVEQIADYDATLKQYAEAAETYPERLEDLAVMKRASELHRVRMEAQRARASAEEAEAANCLAAEQGQWSDLSQRLEELERSLTRRQ